MKVNIKIIKSDGVLFKMGANTEQSISRRLTNGIRLIWMLH